MFAISADFLALRENGFVLSIMILAALILGLYLWGSNRHSNGGKAEQLQKKYKNLSRETLDKIPDKELVDAVAANLMAKLDKGKPDAYITVPILSRGRCTVYSVWLTFHELNSDGLSAYIKSPSGRFLDLTIDGMELIGAKGCAAALKKVKESIPLDEENLLLQQENIRSEFKQEMPLDLCREYIRANPDEFVDGVFSAGDSGKFNTSAE